MTSLNVSTFRLIICIVNRVLVFLFTILCIFLFKAFHKTCFKCADCKKGLDSYNVAEGPDKDIYCKGVFISSVKKQFDNLFILFLYATCPANIFDS